MYCIAATSQPRSPRFMVRLPNAGRPRLPNARRVCGPTTPSTDEPAAALEAHDRGLGQRAADTVHGRVVETDPFQGNLNRRDLGAGEGWGGQSKSDSDHRKCDPTGQDPDGGHTFMLGLTPDGRNR